MQRKQQFETFGDGLLTVCETDGRELTKTRISGVRFGNRTVGVKRFWEAKTAGSRMDRLVSIPLSVLGAERVDIHDVVIINTENVPNSAHQYQVLQVQPKYDARPPALYLSLERVVHTFKDGRSEDAEG